MTVVNCKIYIVVKQKTVFFWHVSERRKNQGYCKINKMDIIYN